MSLPTVASGRKRVIIFDHMVLVAVAALPLAAYRPPRAYGAVGLSVVMLVLGYFLWLLPGLGVRGRWHDPLVLPAFMALTIAYLFLSFVAFFNDPDSAVLILTAQLIALIYASLRW